jgi:hypothetical protein
MRAEHLRSNIASASRFLRLPRLGRAQGFARTLFLAALVVVLGAPFAGVGAQTSNPSILVGKQIRVPEGGEAALTIAVEPSSAIPEGSYLLLVSPKIAFSLSAGSRRKMNNWWLELSQLAGLKISAPPGVNGSSELHLFLYSPGAEVLAHEIRELVIETPAASVVSQSAPQARQTDAAKPPAKEPEAVALKPSGESTAAAGQVTAARPSPPDSPRREAVAPQPGSERGQTVSTREPIAVTEGPRISEAKAPVEKVKIEPATQPPAASVAEPPKSPDMKTAAEPLRTGSIAPIVPVTPQDRYSPAVAPPDIKAQWPRLVEQGDRQIALGNVLVARQYFLRAAETGSAAGALKLAETYEAGTLKLHRAVGVMSDPKEARRWYEVAGQLGAPEAVERLHRLNQK